MASEVNIEPVDEDSYPDRPKIDRSSPVQYKYIPREDISISLPLNTIGNTEKQEATVTLVVSDIHAGDSDFLPRTWSSCVDNTVHVMTKLVQKFDIKNFLLVLNGDVVSGRDVYRYQHLRNLVQRGHWQIELAAQLIRDLKQALAKVRPIEKTFILKGNHENLAENYMIYLTNYMEDTWYAGHYKVLNIGYPIGDYNVLFTHGFGGSSYYPVSYEVIRDCWKAFNQYKAKGVQIEEIALGHFHWLQPRLFLEGLTISVTGGFQRWEKTISQRPSGFLLFIHSQGETSVTGIRPDPEIEADELTASDLEFTNLDFYSQKLTEAIAYLKGKEQPREVVL